MKAKLCFLFTFTLGDIKHHSFYCHINGMSFLRQIVGGKTKISKHRLAYNRYRILIEEAYELDNLRENVYLASIVPPQFLLVEKSDRFTGRLIY